MAHQPHILLRSSWQTVNIGDIGHTPGMLALLERFLPDARVTLWPFNVENGVREMLLRRFPHVQIVEGKWENGKATPELSAVWREATFFLHGSGPSLVARPDVERWAASERPFGVYGVTLEDPTLDLVTLLNKAKFVFTRETASLAQLREAGVNGPFLDFAPDATFALHLRDDETAASFLKRVGLQNQRFVTAIPRLRYTPYFQMQKRAPNEEEARRHRISQQWATQDHQKLARALEYLVREDGMNVLACPEMTYQVPLAKELLIDTQPAAIQDQFAWRNSYWRPDEAASVYARSAAMISFEMHSPIIAVSVGVPAIYLRQPTDTIKGQMWRDIGLNEWILEIDETNAEAVADRLSQILRNPVRAQEILKTARIRIEDQTYKCFDFLLQSVV